jgi:hypothetical protein
MQIAIAQHYQRTPAALADLLAQLVKARLGKCAIDRRPIAGSRFNIHRWYSA